MARLRLVPEPSRDDDGDEPIELTRDRMRRLMFFPPQSEPAVLGALGVWNVRGDSGDVDAWRVLKEALMDRLPGIGLGDVDAWVAEHRAALDSLARHFRVETARRDCLRLWDEIEGPAPAWQGRYDHWSRTCEEAARAAVAAWLAE